MSRLDRRLCTSTQRPMRPCSRSTEANQAYSTSPRTTALSRSQKHSASLALIPAFAWETDRLPAGCALAAKLSCGITPEGRRRLSLAMKKRWAVRKRKKS